MCVVVVNDGGLFPRQKCNMCGCAETSDLQALNAACEEPSHGGRNPPDLTPEENSQLPKDRGLLPLREECAS